MNKINREQAEIEVQSWLAKKKIFDETKESLKAHVDVLIEAVVNGVLILNPETFEFTHKLLHPIGDGDVATINEFKYKARINDKQKSPYMKGVKGDDFEGSFNALLAALTSTSRGEIALMDTTDKRIASAIGVFFT